MKYLNFSGLRVQFIESVGSANPDVPVVIFQKGSHFPIAYSIIGITNARLINHTFITIESG
ncbi:MAG: hypothetical protein LC643_01255 [Bacteroidales bacterium]|nr:hypothetical protein [Bacteroidales bacterium]